MQRVRTEGDAALYALAAELDGVELDALEVPRELRVRALSSLGTHVRRARARRRKHRVRAPRLSAACVGARGTSPASSWDGVPIRSTPLASTRPADARRIRAAC